MRREGGGEKGRSSSLEREAEPGEFGNEREGGTDWMGKGGETSGKVFSEEPTVASNSPEHIALVRGREKRPALQVTMTRGRKEVTFFLAKRELEGISL